MTAFFNAVARARVTLWLSCLVLALALVAVVAPTLMAPGDPLAIAPAEAFQRPGTAHFFGTDESGRDVFTRVVHGARASIGVGLAATAIGVGAGALLGFAAGLGPRWLDRASTRLFEVLFALPTLVLALLFIAVMGAGSGSAVLAIGIATVPGYARLMRARVRGIAQSGYVEWSRLDGVSSMTRFASHIAPNTLWPLVSAVTLGVGQAIVWVSSLGFLGLGSAPPAPEWGAMLNAGRVYLGSAWWMTLFPGLAIVAIASALTVVGRALAARGSNSVRGTRVARRAVGAGSRAVDTSVSPTLTGSGSATGSGADSGSLTAFGNAETALATGAAAVTRATATATADKLDGAIALRVRGLRVESAAGALLEDVSFDVRAGEVLAIVGSSGAGKSVLARSLLGLTSVEAGLNVRAEHLEVAGAELAQASQRAWRMARGATIGLVFQDALQSLDPLRRVGNEVGEALRLRGVRGATLHAQVLATLERVHLDRPAHRAKQRPFELSGGMRQRALVASAIAADPRVLIADEPTTALDSVTSLKLQRLLRESADSGVALVLISHDLASVARIADRVAVLAAGRIVEAGTTAEVFENPRHEATRALLDALPGRAGAGAAVPSPAVRAPLTQPILQLDGVTLRLSGERDEFAGVDNVTLDVRAGEVLGLVGASGAGKTTLGRIIAGAEQPQSGTVTLGTGAATAAPIVASIAAFSHIPAGQRPVRVRVIPQDPAATFDPRWRVRRILEASLGRAAHTDPAVAQGSAAELLASVGLAPAVLDRFPSELSGGQRQRVAIARALAAAPDVLVCDEIVSALDTATQAGVLRVLQRLRRTHGVTLVFVSHDLAVVRQIADRVVVLQRGRVVELGDTADLIANPEHEATRALIEASEPPSFA